LDREQRGRRRDAVAEDDALLLLGERLLVGGRPFAGAVGLRRRELDVARPDAEGRRVERLGQRLRSGERQREREKTSHPPPFRAATMAATPSESGAVFAPR